MKLTELGFHCVAGDVDVAAPLLYRILTVDGETGEAHVIYVGKSNKGSARPFRRYDANIRNMIEGKPPLNGVRFRPVHEDLYVAYRSDRKVVIELVRNVDPEVESVLDAEASLQRSYNIDPRRPKRRLTDDGRPIGG
ncbi:MAG: hypothetical protein EOP06_18185 [Proteobacteria bacterium]|nr:MAG: hypothetical protein EOP06_18185 [Pseudomonadota bacterium]